MASSIVDSPATIASLLDTLAALPTSPPSLYLDLEGTNLSRHGSISIIELLVLPQNHVYLIDVHVLGEKAFSTQSSDGRTLKVVLESPDIPKVFFDVRNDSDALYSHFNISLAGVQDIQLLENAARSFNRRCVNGLAKCIEKDATMTYPQRSDWKTVKEQGRKLFAPEQGGSYEVFNTRPLAEEIRKYCIQDVLFLPGLWSTYSAKVSAAWAEKLQWTGEAYGVGSMALKPSLMVTMAKDEAIELGKDVGLLAGIKASDLQQNVRAAPLMIAVIVDTVRLEPPSK